MIEKEIEAMFAGQDVGDGDVDVDGVLKAFERLQSIATKADLPKLIAAIQSPRNNFWTRELFAEPICRLGGADYLETLLEAAQLGFDEGHDNDGFQACLADIADTEPEKCRAKLEELLARDDFKYHELAKWLLEFCETDSAASRGHSCLPTIIRFWSRPPGSAKGSGFPSVGWYKPMENEQVLGPLNAHTHMPQLKWDETEFIECLEVAPEVAEHQTRHIFTVTKHGLILTLTLWQLESIVTFALRREGSALPVTQFALAVRGGVTLQRHQDGDCLEFRDCVVCPGRFSYIHGPGDPGDVRRFGYSLVVQVAVTPEIQIRFSEVQR